MLYLVVKLEARKRELNRNQLQLMSGVTLPLLTRYWNNATTEVKLDALERIAKALKIPSPSRLILTKEEILETYKMEGWQYLMGKDKKEAA